jgi:hypothetical protein
MKGISEVWRVVASVEGMDATKSFRFLKWAVKYLRAPLTPHPPHLPYSFLSLSLKEKKERIRG